MARGANGVSIRLKLNGRCAPDKIAAVIGRELFHRQIDFADQHALGEFVDHAAHAADDVVHLRPVGRIERQQAFVIWIAVAEIRIGRIVAEWLRP